MTAGAIAVPTIVPLRPPLTGKSKTSIDSNTKCELRSETLDVDIHYTINGTKPEPFQKIGEKCTLKYRGPFTLPPGKRTIKAVAISKDGMRESHVVTKMFDVEYVAMDTTSLQDDGLAFQEQLEKERRKLEAKRAKNVLLTGPTSAWTDMTNSADAQHRMQEMSISPTHQRKPVPAARFTENRFVNTSARYDDRNQTSVVKKPPISARDQYDSVTRAMRVHKETDFLKCIYCYADRPTDPYAKYCLTCGNVVPPLPQTRMPPPEPGQVGMCVYCKSMVPFNTSTCIVCEAPIPQQNQPQASLKLADKKLCTLCGTANPANLTLCLSCDSKLPVGPLPSYGGDAAPAQPIADGKLLRCTKCGRVNNTDARFCDWCGTKPGPAVSSITCTSCRATNHPYASYCGTCGSPIETPLRNASSGFDGMMVRPGQWMNPHHGAGTFSSNPTTSTATQTVGLFYPSQKGLVNKREEDERRQSLADQMSDRRPPITAVSPGRGYWRKQMDHICGHLKSYASNDAEFRALIGEPKMGRLLSATVHEDGYELSLTVNFALRGGKETFTGKNLGLTHNEYLSTHTIDDSYGSVSDLTSERSETPMSTGGRRRAPRRKKPKKKDSEKLSPEDRKLLKEIGKNGEGRPVELQQFIDEGADPSCVNTDDLPALHVAVKNKHADCVPVLVQAGAEVNRKGPPSMKGNPALHEAVNMGPTALNIIDTLIGCGANVQVKNDRAETAYDLASKSGYDNIVRKLASTIGQSQLAKMIKPRA